MSSSQSIPRIVHEIQTSRAEIYAVVPTGDNQVTSTLPLLFLLLLRQDILDGLLDVGVVLSRLGGSVRTVPVLHELHDAPGDRVHLGSAEPAVAFGAGGQVRQQPWRGRRVRRRVRGKAGERRGGCGGAADGVIARWWRQ
jgi:hypothetical protein